MPTTHHNLPYTGHNQRSHFHTRESTVYRRPQSPAPTPVPAPPGDEEYARRLQRIEEYGPLTLDDRFERPGEPPSGLRQPRPIQVLSSDEERLERPVRKVKISRWGPSTNDEGEKKKLVEPMSTSHLFATPTGATERTRVVDLTNKSRMLGPWDYPREKTLGLTPPAPAPSRPSGINIPTPSRTSYTNKPTPNTLNEKEKKFGPAIPFPPMIPRKDADGLREASSRTSETVPTGSQFNSSFPNPTRVSFTEAPTHAPSESSPYNTCF